MVDRTTEFDALEGYFQAARAAAPEPSAALLARIEADAARMTPAPARPVRTRPAPRSVWSRLSLALGGRGAVAGFLAATAVGVWIGFNPPSSVTPITQGLFGDMASLDSVDLIPSFDSLLTEG